MKENVLARVVVLAALATLAGFGLASAPAASAQSTPPPAPAEATAAIGPAPSSIASTASTPALAPADSALYDALGAEAGIAALVEDLTRRVAADPRTAGHFKDVDLVHFRAQLASQFCAVSGGPCVYKGKDMKTVHAGSDITKAHFNAVVELLQEAMDARGIAFGVQNRLLARLAPMHREIVNAPADAGESQSASR